MLDVLSGLVVLALPAALLGVIAWDCWRSPLRVPQTLLWWLTYLLCRLLWRAQTVGRWPLPAGKGAVIVANHRSSIDPAFIAMLMQRAVHWMVAKEYFSNPVFGWFLRQAEMIPTSRGGIDTAATRQAIRAAQSGGLVGIFPEGRINRTAELLLPGRSGAVLVALKARVPIVPCFIHGSPYDGTPAGAVLMPAKVRIVLGQPLDLSPWYDEAEDRAVLAELTREVLRRIAELGGHGDFQTQVAGRHATAAGATV